MRTIQFRGRDAVHPDHPWRYGDLTHNMRVTLTGTSPRTMVGGYEVMPDTVGEYAGLQDRTGRDIYEGDILRYGSTALTESYFEVKYSAGAFIAESRHMYSNPLLTLGTVAGNIYENPELLEIKPFV